ncbi:MAG TPA: MBOAT family protein [Rhizomicrobium sp.]|nr:MBOAT family protein [Rhizomicrobium sp.]
MLFNSDIFLFEFLPAVLAGFFLAKRIAGARAAQIWLTLASLAFYAAGGVRFLLPLSASIFANYFVGRTLTRLHASGRKTAPLLATGIALNIGLLAWYKYTNFLLGNLQAAGFPTTALHIALPIGISFYTFTQIAFLVDAARGGAEEYDFVRYVLFVTFFPHLIAGPIVHHREMMPQFAPRRLEQGSFDLLPAGIMLFAIGLAKKVLLADSFAAMASPIFDSAATAPPDLLGAWGATLSYTFQIYFDFSGYSDMALGLALMFGIRLPVNFLSPYKSTSIIEFWRSWHMTLSRFLRDYLYIPLGGNRKGRLRRHVNLLIVMAIGGLWHGAGWTFVLWGLLHGTYLVINHAWIRLAGASAAMPVWAARLLTFLCVAFAWVLFRSDSLEAARAIYAGLFGLNGITLSPELLAALGHHQPFTVLGLQLVPGYFQDTLPWQVGALCLLGLIIVWGLPNSMEICGFAPAPAWSKFAFHTRPAYAVANAVLLFACISVVNSGAVSEFIYYRF